MKTIRVNLTTPNETLWQGDAKYIQSENTQGAFSIFPGHANFITAIINKPIKIVTKDESVDHTFENSVLYVHDDVLSIYVLP